LESEEIFEGKGRANWTFWILISVTKFCDEHVMNDHLHGFESRGFQLEKGWRECVHESKVVSSLEELEAKESGIRRVKRRRLKK
jgi:hypothetical protein